MFNVEYPHTHPENHYTSCGMTADKWKAKGDEVTHHECLEGGDTYDHQMYCGCAGHGWWYNQSAKKQTPTQPPIDRP